MICFIGWHRWICADVEWHGTMLLQFFKCARCGKQDNVCGFMDHSKELK